MQHILVTGANRGIGLELVRQYVHQKTINHIFATARNPEEASDLRALAAERSGRITIIQLDINDDDSRNASLKTVQQHTDKLDILINNAGINIRDDSGTRLGSLKAEALAHNITTNAVSPLIISQLYLDLLKKGENSRLVMISSQLGSIQNATGGGYAYRMSKAAMNMAARILSKDPTTSDLITVTMHPGWVQTDMGGKHASLTVPESAEGIINVVDNLKPEDSGSFLQWNGSTLPW